MTVNDDNAKKRAELAEFFRSELDRVSHFLPDRLPPDCIDAIGLAQDIKARVKAGGSGLPEWMEPSWSACSVTQKCLRLAAYAIAQAMETRGVYCGRVELHFLLPDTLPPEQPKETT